MADIGEGPSTSAAANYGAEAFQTEEHDMNNNDPNNNTDFSSPLDLTAVESVLGRDREEESLNQPVMVFEEDQSTEDIAQMLEREAQELQLLFPNRQLAEIYAYLEGMVRHPQRMQAVAEELLVQAGNADVIVVDDDTGMAGAVPRRSNLGRADIPVGAKAAVTHEDQTTLTLEEKVGMLKEMFPALTRHKLRRLVQSEAPDMESLRRLIMRLTHDDDLARLLPEPPADTIVIDDEGNRLKVPDVKETQNQTPNHSQAQAQTEDNRQDQDQKLDPNAMNRQLEMLGSLFPDADPDFLMGKVQEVGGNEAKLTEVVSQLLEKRDYPSMADYQRRKKMEEERSRYLERWNLHDFLAMFEDPLTYFYDEIRPVSAMYKKHVLAFLQKQFRFTRLQRIYECLNKHKYHLAPSNADLEKNPYPKIKRPRGQFSCVQPTTIDLPFVQEMSFVLHETEITTYLESEKQRRANALAEGRLKGELLECGCCFDAECLSDDMASCSEGHLFCCNCVRQGTETLLGQARTSFPCYEEGCSAEFPIATLQKVLKPAAFSKLLQRKQAEEVEAAGIDNLETCPFCCFATVVPPECQDKVFRCLNPDCQRNSCRLCRRPSHIPMRCEEVEGDEEVRLRKAIEDRMTEALIHKCHKCSRQFFKEDGCNMIYCVCGARSCYVCRKPVENYSHFGTDRCPLWQDSKHENANVVIEEAQRAKEEVLQKNPHVKLKHDPTSNLPSLPKRKRTANEMAQVHDHALMDGNVPLLMAQFQMNLPQVALRQYEELRQHHHHHHHHHHRLQQPDVLRRNMVVPRAPEPVPPRVARAAAAVHAGVPVDLQFVNNAVNQAQEVMHVVDNLLIRIVGAAGRDRERMVRFHLPAAPNPVPPAPGAINIPEPLHPIPQLRIVMEPRAEPQQQQQQNQIQPAQQPEVRNRVPDVLQREFEIPPVARQQQQQHGRMYEFFNYLPARQIPAFNPHKP